MSQASYWVRPCRTEHLQKDFAALVALLNKRMPAGQEPLKAELRRMQLGPLANASTGNDTASASGSEIEPAGQQEQPTSRYLEKFMQCGSLCFERTQAYYRRDFELFSFPTFHKHRAAQAAQAASQIGTAAAAAAAAAGVQAAQVVRQNDTPLAAASATA